MGDLTLPWWLWTILVATLYGLGELRYRQGFRHGRMEGLLDRIEEIVHDDREAGGDG